jgi:hypothetical protein
MNISGICTSLRKLKNIQFYFDYYLLYFIFNSLLSETFIVYSALRLRILGIRLVSSTVRQLNGIILHFMLWFLFSLYIPTLCLRIPIGTD